MVCWPGDTPFERQQTMRIEDGDICNLSHIRSTAHIGTHMDAPSHFVRGGSGMETLPIAAVIGPARVIGIRDPELIRVEELAPPQPAKGERILFKTANSARCWKTDAFQEDFVYIPEATALYLAQCGVQTVGVDYLSVGGFHRDSAETHRALLGAGIWVIEGLNLENVEPGNYELVCLPLKIVGGDGAPARAVVRPLDSIS